MSLTRLRSATWPTSAPIPASNTPERLTTTKATSNHPLKWSSPKRTTNRRYAGAITAATSQARSGWRQDQASPKPTISAAARTRKATREIKPSSRGATYRTATRAMSDRPSHARANQTLRHAEFKRHLTDKANRPRAGGAQAPPASGPVERVVRPLHVRAHAKP